MRNAIIVMAILAATAAVSYRVYNVGPYTQYVEPLTEVMVRAEAAEVERARRMAKPRDYPDAAVWRGEISYVYLRHEMYGAARGRIFLDLKQMDPEVMMTELVMRFSFLPWAFERGNYPRRPLGPLKGWFNMGEALDTVLEGSGCAWNPRNEVYLTFDCNNTQPEKKT
jgi:hypothetical protein